jgi:para-nitrobenzyl esterase
VLVWVHGGGFVSGAGSSYDGARLAARGDVVVVTVTYRLGPWGFLDLTSGDEPGGANLGLLDLVAALRWVRDIVAAFGGDPGRVTLFGESAGAMCVGALLAVPAARGLFHRAVLQSGAASTVRGPATADRVRDRYLALLGRDPAGASTEELAHAAENLLASPARPAEGAVADDPFVPTIDGIVLPEDPLVAVAAGSCRDVPLLVTWCRDEVELFFLVDPGTVPARLERRAGSVLGAEVWRGLIDLYVADLGGDPVAARSALLTDAVWALPALRLAAAANQGGGRAWAARFDHAVGGPGRPVMHTADLALTWGRADAASADPDRRAAAFWQDALFAFARAGDPATSGLIGWSAYDPEDEATLLISPEPRVVARPGGRRHAAWAGLPLP